MSQCVIQADEINSKDVHILKEKNNVDVGDNEIKDESHQSLVERKQAESCALGCC